MQPANNVNRVRSQVLEIDSYRRSPIVSEPTEARIIPREVFRSNFWKKENALLEVVRMKVRVIASSATFNFKNEGNKCYRDPDRRSHCVYECSTDDLNNDITDISEIHTLSFVQYSLWYATIS